MRRAEVWWRHEPGDKPRPVCILTRNEAIEVLNSVLVAPATTTRRGATTEVPLDVEDGMPRACVLSLDNVTYVRKAYLTEKITALTPAKMHEVCNALRFATGC